MLAAVGNNKTKIVQVRITTKTLLNTGKVDNPEILSVMLISTKTHLNLSFHKGTDVGRWVNLTLELSKHKLFLRYIIWRSHLNSTCIFLRSYCNNYIFDLTEYSSSSLSLGGQPRPNFTPVLHMHPRGCSLLQIYAHSAVHKPCRPIRSGWCNRWPILLLTSILTRLLLTLHITHFFSFKTALSWLHFWDTGQCTVTCQLWLANSTSTKPYLLQTTSHYMRNVQFQVLLNLRGSFKWLGP